METNKIQLRREREFGEVFNATFGFIRQEFKPLCRSLLVFVLPLVLLMGILFSFVMNELFSLGRTAGSDDFSTIFGVMGLLLIFYLLFLLSQMMLSLTIFSYLRVYLNDPEEINISNIFKEIRRNFFPVLGATLLGAIMIAIGAVMCYVPGIYLGVSLSMVLVSLVIEKIGIGHAIGRTFQLSHMKWWWTFLIIFVAIIINGIIIMLSYIPGYILLFTYMLNNAKAQMDFTQTMRLIFAVYVSFVMIVAHLVNVIPNLLISFQYFNLVELREKTSLIKEIGEIEA